MFLMNKESELDWMQASVYGTKGGHFDVLRDGPGNIAFHLL